MVICVFNDVLIVEQDLLIFKIMSGSFNSF